MSGRRPSTNGIGTGGMPLTTPCAMASSSVGQSAPNVPPGWVSVTSRTRSAVSGSPFWSTRRPETTTGRPPGTRWPRLSITRPVRRTRGPVPGSSLGSTGSGAAGVAGTTTGLASASADRVRSMIVTPAGETMVTVAVPTSGASAIVSAKSPSAASGAADSSRTGSAVGGVASRSPRSTV